jgi:signal peptidase I
MRRCPPPSTHRRRPLFWVFGVLVIFLAAVGSYPSLAYQVVGYQAYVIPTNSMAPTIVAGDRISVEQGGAQREPRRGEIWLFRGPGPVAPPMIKRVIGIPGDTVAVTGGQVLVNGRALTEPYIRAAPTYTMPTIKLGSDEYLMFGDNRNLSNDSHVWGPAQRSRFIGRVRLRFWPPNRVRGL